MSFGVKGLILHVVALEHISRYAEHAIVLRFLAGEKDSSLLQGFNTGFGTHTASCSVGVEGPVLGA
jgi:hypothetical protein